MKLKARLFFLFLSLGLFGSLQNTTYSFARGGLTGALNDVADQIGGSGSESPDTSTAPSNTPSPEAPQAHAPQETAPPAETTPAPPPAPEKQDEFYPGKTLAQLTDPATGNTTSLVKMPDGSVKAVEKDANGNIVSEKEFSPEEAAKLLPSEEGGSVELTKRPDGQTEVRQYDRDGQLLSSEIIPGKELPSASAYDPATGITTSSQKNPDGSRTVTKTDKDGNVISEEKIPPRGQGGASASSYDPKTGVTTTSRSNPDGSHTVTAENRDGSQTVTQQDKNGKVISQEAVPAPQAPSSAAPSAQPQAPVSEGTSPSNAAPSTAPETAGPVGEEPQTAVPQATGSGTQPEAVPADAAQPEAPTDSILDQLSPSPNEEAAAARKSHEDAVRDGTVDANPADWEQAAARAASGEGPAVNPAPDDQAETYKQQDARVAAREAERQERLTKLDWETLTRQRAEAEESANRFAEQADQKARAEGRSQWTPEEWAEYDKRQNRAIELDTLTPEEEGQVAVAQQVRDKVKSDIANIGRATGRGWTDPEAISERAHDAEMADAATRTWRDATFTGKMVDEVHADITAQRELGIQANNEVLAAQHYLQKPNLTPEERRAGEQILESATQRRGHAAEAISRDTALVLSGTAADVAMIGVGRGASIVGQKAGQGASALWTRLFGEEAAGVAPSAVPPVPAPRPTAPAPRTSAGGQAATEAEQAAAPKPSQMSPAQRQAYADAHGDADIKGVLSDPTRELIDGGTGVLPAPTGAAVQPAVGELSKGLTQAEINALFKPGANLTSEQIVQKADLLMTGYRPPVIGAPGLPPPNVVAGAADNSATVVLSGQEAAAGTGAEAGTVITGAGGRGAATGSTTIVENGAGVDPAARQ